MRMIPGCILSSIVAVLTACGGVDDVAESRTESAIRSGREFHALPAIGAIRRVGAGAPALHCTGTLIAPDVVLTAAHCISPPKGREMKLEDFEFIVGESVESPAAARKLERTLIHPKYVRGDPRTPDLGLIELERPILDIAPLRVSTGDASSDGSVWRKFKSGAFVVVGLVGYGASDYRDDKPTTIGVRRGLAVPFGRIFPPPFTIEFGRFAPWRDAPPRGHGGFILRRSPEMEGACPGDSGGPMLADSSEGVVLVGVASGGNGSKCRSTEYYYESTYDEASFLSSLGP